MATIRIGITQRVEMLHDRNERRDCLDQRWIPLLSELGFLGVPIPNALPDPAAWIDALGISGVILSGGNDPALIDGGSNVAPERDALERLLIRRCAHLGMPLLGVCRGLQFLVLEYGGNVTAVEDHVRRDHPIEADPKNPMGLESRDDVNSYHNFGVKPEDLPPPLIAVGRAIDGTVEAAAHSTLPQWGIMWHPERPAYDRRDGDLIRRLFLGGAA